VRVKTRIPNFNAFTPLVSCDFAGTRREPRARRSSNLLLFDIFSPLLGPNVETKRKRCTPRNVSLLLLLLAALCGAIIMTFGVPRLFDSGRTTQVVPEVSTFRQTKLIRLPVSFCLRNSNQRDCRSWRRSTTTISKNALRG